MKIPCPKCGADIIYDVYREQLYCETCNCYSQIYDLDIDKVIKFNETYDEYKCSSCGASLIAGKNTILTKCAFCNSRQIIDLKISREFKPDFIVPFKIDKDEIKGCIEKYIIKHRFLQKKPIYLGSVEDIRGVYVPYKAYRIETSLDYKGATTMLQGYSSDSTNLDADTIVVPKRINRGYQSEENLEIIVDASKRLNDNITASLEPFNLKPLHVLKFNPIYMLGFQAEWLDVKDSVLEKNAIDKAIVHAMQPIKNVYIDKIFQRGNIDLEVKSEKDSKLYLLPVWFANMKYKRKKIPVIVNGQTGKVIGKFLLDYNKIFTIKLMLYMVGIPTIISAHYLKGILFRKPLYVGYEVPLVTILMAIGYSIIVIALLWSFGIRKRNKSIHSALNSHVRVLSSRVEKEEGNKNKRKFRWPLKKQLLINGKDYGQKYLDKLMKKSIKEYYKTHNKIPISYFGSENEANKNR